MRFAPSPLARDTPFHSPKRSLREEKADNLVTRAELNGADRIDLPLCNAKALEPLGDCFWGEPHLEQCSGNQARDLHEFFWHPERTIVADG